MSLEILNDVRAGEGKPLLCLEVNPPRGTDIAVVFERLSGWLAGVNFFNITDSALARMRFAALPFASLLKQRFGIEPLVNLSCRDRNVLALQSDLLAGWAMGVRSIVALTGDAMTVGDSPERKGVFEVNSVGLLNLVARLNSGLDMAGNELDGRPSYCCGAVVNPNARNAAAEIKRLMRKKEAGACYALSQPIFDQAQAVHFFSEAKAVGIPIFMGLLAWRTSKAALGMANIPGIRVPEALVTEVEARAGQDLSDFSIDYSLRLAEACRPHVAGFHVISGTTPKLALRLAQSVSTHFALA